MFFTQEMLMRNRLYRRLAGLLVSNRVRTRETERKLGFHVQESTNFYEGLIYKSCENYKVKIIRYVVVSLLLFTRIITYGTILSILDKD